MTVLITELRKHIFIYLLFMKNCLISQMEYRVNFIFSCMVELAYFAIKLTYVVVVYNLGVNIKGLSPDAILLFVGSYTTMTGFFMMFFWQNFASLPENIASGNLDMYIVKPVSMQFITTLRHVDVGFPIPNLVGGIVMTVLGWQRTGIEFNLKNISGFVLYMLTGICLSYSLFLLPQLLAFRTVKTGGLLEISNALWDFNNMPMGIYNKFVQRVGTFILPLLLITNYSPLFVLGKLTVPSMIWGIAAPIIFTFITRLL
ncbi:MAG TPA: ABC-2 family transporter protein, partial [Ruminiclostridium sp.]|nr:ABC-2 family transporter protein [Ruminiclostridium sp.]